MLRRFSDLGCAVFSAAGSLCWSNQIPDQAKQLFMPF
ncbi:hypothetical protein V6Z11_D01G044200 [Gossypium hirsutum]